MENFFVIHRNSNEKTYVFKMVGNKFEIRYHKLTRELDYTSSSDKSLAFNLTLLHQYGLQFRKVFDQDQMRKLTLILLQESNEQSYYSTFQLLLNISVDFIDFQVLRHLANERYLDTYKMCQAFNSGEKPELIILANLSMAKMMFPDKLDGNMLHDLRNGYSVAMGMREIKVEE